MAKNIGEYDEMRIKLRLIELRDTHQTIVVNGHSIQIDSVKMDSEFLPLPVSTNLSNMSDTDIEKLAKQVGAGKAPMGAKADVLINDIGYSVKSHRSAAPAIVNHTPRWGWYRICQQIGVDIQPLDEMVNNYFQLRAAGTIGEDIFNGSPSSPFAAHKEYMRPILNYFLFKGTGSGDSSYPATFVLDCADSYNVSTWQLHDENDYLDMYWDRLVFSMRNKGFENYPYSAGNAELKNKQSKPWAFKFDGSFKGSLHIRVR